MISVKNLFEVNPALVGALRQGAIWGAAGGGTAALTQDRAKTKEQRKKNLKNIGIGVGLSGLAGLAGSMFD